MRFRRLCGLLAATTAATMTAPRPAVSQTPTVTAADPPAGVAIDHVRWVTIDAPGIGVMRAAIARPEGAGPFPVVLILHGTHGFAQEYARLARDLARGGVLAVAPCWFTGRGGPTTGVVTPIDCPGAPPLVVGSTPEAMRTVGALVAATRALPDARGDRVALVGQSRGAVAALGYALGGDTTLRAVVLNSAPYPDELVTPARALRVPVLLLHGAADSLNAMTAVGRARRFEAAVRDGGGRVEATYYPGAGHVTIFEDRAQWGDSVRRISAFLRAHLLP